ncbi:dithiol-disulfide isomerase [Intrasporangium oryzae NRRL B-24470]|uniref:Dithiol-disulfide isomerase n=1 Tax=Intrasporangium oryzae NRRL B-24470 TaxID=1386089 RepID=W9G7H7_9MICO|nr:DsbA family oxidoreductase [Intrasporangium oryzae]EWT01232.1 dithiol-disulfide isomerase [Intrasporangium oryzae NRRL B-24470]
MKIDIWSDIVCPLCYIGKRRLETAVARFEHADELEIQWHSFELDRGAAAVVDGELVDLVARKYGTTREQAVAQHESMAAAAAELGLEFNWQQARYGNTFDAHRVVHLAAEQGLADAAHERLMRAYFSDGLAVGDRETLVRLATEIGLDEPVVRDMLDSDDYGNHVRSDEATAKMLGIEAVPFFVFDRKYGISGAQPTEVFTQALETAWSTRHEVPEPAVAAGGCGGGCGAGGCGGVCGR